MIIARQWEASLMSQRTLIEDFSGKDLKRKEVLTAMCLRKDEGQVKPAGGWKEKRGKARQVPHAEAPIGRLMRSRRRFRRLSAP